MSLWLTEEEIHTLTGTKRRKRWLPLLAAMKVEFRVRPLDGFPLIPRYQFQGATVQSKPRAKAEPNYGAANG